MDHKVIELYTDEDIKKIESRISTWRAFVIIFVLIALFFCIFMVTRTGTANARRMELLVIGISTISGWIVIYSCIFKLDPSKKELSHAGMLHSEEREKFCGKIRFNGENFKIRKSVSVCGLELITENKAGQTQDGYRETWFDEDTGPRTISLLVAESRAGMLKGLDEAVLYVCHGYVAAYEKAG